MPQSYKKRVPSILTAPTSLEMLQNLDIAHLPAKSRPPAGCFHFSTAPVGIVVTNNLYAAKSERAKLPHAREFRDHSQPCIPPGKLR
jgi:hypothetical protein